MNKKNMIVLSIILLATVLLPVMVFASQSKKVILSKAEETKSSLLVQNNQPLPPPNTSSLIKDKEFNLISDLVYFSETTREMMYENLTYRYLLNLLINLNKENPRQFAADIKTQAESIKKAVDYIDFSISEVIQSITLVHNDLQIMRPNSIIMKEEKRELLQSAEAYFFELKDSLSDLRNVLESPILQELNALNAVGQNPDLQTATENTKVAITNAQKIEDKIHNQLGPFVTGYLNTLVSIPERLEGDLNGDGKVDIFDLVTVAKNFGKKL